MKNFYVSEYTIMDFDFYDLRNVSMHYHQNVELLVVLEGRLTLILDEEDVLLDEEDFYIINVNRRHAIKTDGPVLYICLHMNFNLLSRYIDMNRIILMCFSKKMKHGLLKKFKDVIYQIISSYFAKSGAAQVKLNMIYYALLNLIIENCLFYSDDMRFQNRKSVDQNRLNEIVNYVYANYRDEISLSDLADSLYLSSAYLSKYIKSRLGMNFVDYVNNIRLYHALEEIRGTDKKMTHIAVDNGFSSITAFNKAFKKIYDTTPTDFRVQAKQKSESKGLLETGNMQIVKKAQEYLGNREFEKNPNQQEKKYIMSDAYEQKIYNKYWMQMINISKMSDLLLSDVQKHVALLKKELKFSYIRFWDIYAEEMDLNIISGDGVYNFGKMDQVFDFLYENRIYPYIELGFKPLILVEKLDGYIISQKKEIIFKTETEYQSFLYAMITHYANRYGIKEVEHWYFEQWKDPRLLDGNNYQQYFNVFETAYYTIKTISPKIKFGGGSIHNTFDELFFEDFLQQWQQRIIHPDFISIYSYPYSAGEAGQAIDRRRSQNPDYLKNSIESVKSSLTKIGFSLSELHVSEWNSSVSNRNKMNDSVYKGAYIVKNLIDNIGKVDFLGYWLGSDLFSQYRSQNSILNGGVGLLSRDGIKKPSFYAYNFMNHMGEYMLGKYENAFVTSNGHDDYYIVSHNAKSLNYKYYKTPENEIDTTKQEEYFEDYGKLQINYQIKHVKNGTYQIKVRKVNGKEGSILDSWIQMGQFPNLTIPDIDYLRQISTARVLMWESNVCDEVLNFETALEPNEIQYVHITYRFK